MQTIPPLDLLRSQQSAELCSHFTPSEDAHRLLASFNDVNSFLDVLMRQRLWRDAALVLAHGLPKRVAVWWACTACRQQLDEISLHDPEKLQTFDSELGAIKAAQLWVRDPQEKFRLAACAAATLAGNRSPAHWAAMAAFWSTGNMTPDSGVMTSPPQFLYAVAVVSALEFAAARCGQRRNEFFHRTLQRGISLASGGDGR